MDAVLAHAKSEVALLMGLGPSLAERLPAAMPSATIDAVVLVGWRTSTLSGARSTVDDRRHAGWDPATVGAQRWRVGICFIRLPPNGGRAWMAGYCYSRRGAGQPAAAGRPAKRTQLSMTVICSGPPGIAMRPGPDVVRSPLASYSMKP